MNSFIVGIIAVIAGLFAAILFGRPQGKSDQSVPPSIEQVESPPAPVLPAASGVATNPPNAAPKIADPWVDAPVAATPIAALPIRELPARTESTMVESMTTGLNQASPAVRAAAMAAVGSVSARSMPPFAAIHDPKRPSTPDLQDLSQEIVSLGTAQKLSNVPQLLQYRKHDDPLIRCYVAHAIGNIAAAHTLKSEVQSTIPFLGELAADQDSEVRQMAIRALSRIQSPDVLPYLEKSLVGAAGAAKASAIAAIAKLKSLSGTV
jgi:HEAT repeats